MQKSETQKFKPLKFVCVVFFGFSKTQNNKITFSPHFPDVVGILHPSPGLRAIAPIIG